MIIIALSTGIIVLYYDGHDPRGILAEVYDDPQPAVRLDVLAVETLATGDRVQDTMVGPRDRPHDHVDVIEQPGTPIGKMQSRARVKDHQPTVGVGCVWMLVGHDP
ncbi:MAG: hypothetical protein ACLPUT_13810 [Solirubrobacteraceae bacterium]